MNRLFGLEVRRPFQERHPWVRFPLSPWIYFLVERERERPRGRQRDRDIKSGRKRETETEKQRERAGRRRGGGHREAETDGLTYRGRETAKKTELREVTRHIPAPVKLCIIILGSRFQIKVFCLGHESCI